MPKLQKSLPELRGSTVEGNLPNLVLSGIWQRLQNLYREPARNKEFCQKKMSNLKFKFWRDSLQTSVQICHESVAISVKVNRESDFCQPFICISFFFFELVHPVLWLRLMVFTVVEFSAYIYKNESMSNQEFISWTVYISWFLTIFWNSHQPWQWFLSTLYMHIFLLLRTGAPCIMA